MAKRLAEVKVETFATLLSEIKAEALIDTLANRLTDVELEIMPKQWPDYTQTCLSKN